MYKADLERQRETGKQLVLLNILHYDEDLAQRNGRSFVSRDNLAAWSAMSKDRFDHFMDLYRVLHPYNLPDEAAKKCCKEDPFKSEKDAWVFLLSTYYRMGNLFLLTLDIEKFEDYCREYSERNYQTYDVRHGADCPVSDSYAEPKLFEKAMKFYIRYLVDKIKEVLSEGYDWDVITGMMKTSLSKERFLNLATAFGSKDKIEEEEWIKQF